MNRRGAQEHATAQASQKKKLSHVGSQFVGL
jgi:hypothetical protein